MRRRWVLLASPLLGVAFASSASAHVVPSPAAVKPGTVATVAFTIPHGCSGSPTTTVAIKVPPSLTDVKTVAPKGWTGSVKNSVATFRGGSLPAKTKGKFSLTFTAPKTGGKLLFPTIQTCAVGKTSWTEPTPADGSVPDHPIPVVLVTSSPPKTKTTTPIHN